MTSYYFPNEFRDSHMRPDAGSTAKTGGLGKFTLSKSGSQLSRGSSSATTSRSDALLAHGKRHPAVHGPWMATTLAHAGNPRSPDPYRYPPRGEPTYMAHPPTSGRSLARGRYTRMHAASGDTFLAIPRVDDAPVYRNVPVVSEKCRCDPCLLHGLNCKHVKGVLPVVSDPYDPSPMPQKFVDAKRTMVVDMRAYEAGKEEEYRQCASRCSRMFITMWVIIGVVILGLIVGIVIWVSL
ncbi:PREDICTED: uncharacterized protein LOC106805515 [Priapulus caudatus]|uniref:Uncharacterized protein LOC106805515 n=1 Tax=Priapulus caudatus TaxID=37621 RepID=A0ABM1DRQ1_PRICU|nr:PREDICTED: uncharacterized protein LOC106805515 [Priapulus caudatus]